MRCAETAAAAARLSAGKRRLAPGAPPQHGRSALGRAARVRQRGARLSSCERVCYWTVRVRASVLRKGKLSDALGTLAHTDRPPPRHRPRHITAHTESETIGPPRTNRHTLDAHSRTASPRLSAPLRASPRLSAPLRAAARSSPRRHNFGLGRKPVHTQLASVRRACGLRRTRSRRACGGRQRHALLAEGVRVAGCGANAPYRAPGAAGGVVCTVGRRARWRAPRKGTQKKSLDAVVAWRATASSNHSVVAYGSLPAAWVSR